MHKIIEEKTRALKDRIKAIEKMDEDLKLITSLLPNGHIWLDYDINLSMVVTSMEEVTRVLKLLAKNGFRQEKYIKSDTSPTWYLRRKKETRIVFTPEWTKEEGATCRLVQVGVFKQEYPKYKLVCDEEGVIADRERRTK